MPEKLDNYQVAKLGFCSRPPEARVQALYLCMMTLCEQNLVSYADALSTPALLVA